MKPVKFGFSDVSKDHNLLEEVNSHANIFVTVYRKTGHNGAPFEKFFFALTELSASILLSSPSFIVAA